ncbi:MAG: trypsin-like peptidase domain-containing protein [bacterium]|nr:trypsin-like peptidase domain-containing protein [bacterium]
MRYIIIFFAIISAIFFFGKNSNKKEVPKNDADEEIVFTVQTPPSELPQTDAAIDEKTREIPISTKSMQPISKPTTEEKIVLPPPPRIIPEVVPVPKTENSVTQPATTSVIEEPKKIEPDIPPLNEAALLKSVVKIECPADGGKYIGSGFAVKGDVIITAAHVVADSASEICTIIFPDKRRPIHYLKGTIVDLESTKKRLNEDGIDFALLKLPSLDSYPDAKAIYGESYPYIPYPSCSDPKMLDDKLLHFGYPSNFVDQNYLSELNGESIAFADINGIKDQLSQDQTFTFKSPILEFSYDEFKHHPYMVSRVASFYGDSGGLAFNATKQCILGPHRGGTIGRGAGENFSIFMNIGWEGIQKIISP